MSEIKKFEVYDSEDKLVNSYIEKEKAESLVAKHPGWYVSTKGKAKDAEDNEGVKSYAELSAKELLAEIAARELTAPAKAKKPALIKILEENDTETNGK